MKNISESELEVMQVLWKNGESTSIEIINEITKKKDWKNNTIMTLVSRLVKKEFVEIVGQDSLTRFDKTKKRKKKGGNSNSKGKAFEDSNLELRQKSKELPKLQSDERKGDANVRRNDRVDEGRRREKPRRNRDRNFGRQGRPKNDNTSSGQNQTNEIQ